MNVATGTEGVLALADKYGVADLAAFLLDHVHVLTSGDAGELAQRCGEVLEKVIGGFGIGAEAGAMLIGVGQVLLGNPMTPASAAAVVTNPVAMTCAAVGAIHYGWKALRSEERDTIVATIARAFNVGGELVRAVVEFALKLLRELASQLAELKKWVAGGAATFGHGVSYVTRSVADRAWDMGRSSAAIAGSATLAVRRHLPSRRGE